MADQFDCYVAEIQPIRARLTQEANLLRVYSIGFEFYYRRASFFTTHHFFC